MLYDVKSLKGYVIGAKDGDIGKLYDFYVDDEFWTIRYLVADTGSWLQNRKVFISPFALGKVDVSGERFNVALTMKQVEKSPDIDTDKLVSRQHEASCLDYYGYPYYWEGAFLWGPLPHPLLSNAEGKRDDEVRAKQEEARGSHLCSANRVTGYHIEGTDGGIGHVEDFVVNGKTWEIRYMVVHTRNWWPGKKVLIAPPWVDRVSGDESKVYVGLTREAIKNAPEHRPEAFSRTYEETLYDYYKRPSSSDNRVGG